MLAAGEIIDKKYEIIRVLGQGGVSTVYLGRHITLGTERAIKEVCRNDCEKYEELRQQCIREADILKSLNHPGLPEIIDIIIEKDFLLIIMEYIPGCTLKALMEIHGAMEEEMVVDWGRQLCNVLSYLHTRTPPVIYRDLKPANVMRRPDGKIILIDFGTAREYRNTVAWEDTVCLGTRGYAAPEQYAADGQTDERTDIYCLGVTLYHLLTGKNPEQPPYAIYPIRKWNPAFSPGLEKFILTCTKQNPEERYQNCQAAGYILEHLEESTNKYRRKEKRKICLFFFMTAGMVLCVAAVAFCRNTVKDIRENVAKMYVEQAERTPDRESMEENYIKALEVYPSDKQIYESLLKQYVRPNDFQVEDAAELMNILETAGKEGKGKPVLEILRQQDPETYGSFCYDMGIGYFFHMGSTEGKKTAQLWFEDACQTPEESMTKGRKERAYLYGKISSYYNTFLTSGTDRSGEREAPGFADFFNTLCSLNEIVLRESSSSSQAAAAYMISVEVAAELGSFAYQFQKDGRISCKKIQSELDKIYQEDTTSSVPHTDKRVLGRIKILEAFREKEEIDNLRNLVEDARRKNVLAAMHLKQGGV